MQVLQATVLFPAGKAFPSKVAQGRDRQSVKLKLADESEISIWFDAGDRRYCSLTRGEVVQVIRNKDKYTVAFPEEDTPTPTTTPAALSSNSPAPEPTIPGERLSSADKAKLFQDLCFRAKVLRSCHVQVQTMFTNVDTGEVVIDEETIQKYAVTLYLDLKHYWQ